LRVCFRGCRLFGARAGTALQCLPESVCARQHPVQHLLPHMSFQILMSSLSPVPFPQYVAAETVRLFRARPGAAFQYVHGCPTAMPSPAYSSPLLPSVFFPCRGWVQFLLSQYVALRGLSGRSGRIRGYPPMCVRTNMRQLAKQLAIAVCSLSLVSCYPQACCPCPAFAFGPCPASGCDRGSGLLFDDGGSGGATGRYEGSLRTTMP
jgi:hypothetical protein